MSNFAVIETGGKQYKVSAGQKIKVEKLLAEQGGKFVIDKVLLTVQGDAVKVGAPYLSGVTVETKVLSQMRDKKKLIFRYHSKTRYRKLKGHRQHFTELHVKKI